MCLAISMMVLSNFKVCPWSLVLLKDVYTPEQSGARQRCDSIRGQIVRFLSQHVWSNLSILKGGIV